MFNQSPNSVEFTSSCPSSLTLLAQVTASLLWPYQPAARTTSNWSPRLPSGSSPTHPLDTVGKPAHLTPTLKAPHSFPITSKHCSTPGLVQPQQEHQILLQPPSLHITSSKVDGLSDISQVHPPPSGCYLQVWAHILPQSPVPSPFPFLLHWLDLQAELHLGNPCSRKLSPSASGFFLILGFVPKHLLSIYWLSVSSMRLQAGAGFILLTLRCMSGI